MKTTIEKEEVGIDAPLYHPQSDCLDRAQFAERIYKIIDGTPPSTNMTIGILGAWGTGKSTAMNFLRHYCHEAGHPTAIFNPWQFRNRDDAWKGFVASIDRGIADWKGYRIGTFKRQRAVKKVSAAFRKYTSATAVGKWAGSLILKPLEGALDETKDRVQKELNKALREKRLFVFIDDLDRAEPEIVYDMLMLLNEIVDLSRCIYIIGLDDNVAAKLINKKTGLDILESKEFLEKIIKWPFRLPEPSILEWHELLDGEISSMDKNVKIDALQAIFDYLPKNPRRLKHFLRYISGLHKSFLSRFNDNEFNWKVLYLAQLIRIEFPEVFQKLIADALVMKDFAMGFLEVKSDEGDIPQWKKDIEKTTDMLVAGEKERFFSLYGEIRHSGAILSTEHLRNHFLVVEAPDLLTWKEYYEFKNELLTLSDDSLTKRLRIFAKVGAKAKQVERVREFLKTLVRDRDSLLSRAADTVDQEEGMKPLINEVKDVLRICFLLLDIEDLFIGHNPTFNSEVFEEWYKQIIKWVPFQRPAEIYSEVRLLEGELAIKLASKMISRSSEILELLSKIDRDPFDDRKAFESTHKAIIDMLERALVEEILGRFRRVDGIAELNRGPRIYRAEKRLLFHDNPIMHNATVYDQLKSLAQEAKQDLVIQNNFYELATTMFYAATDHLNGTDRDKVVELLVKKDFIHIVWPAAVARPMNLRTVGSLEEQKNKIINNILKDDKALPIPTWYKQLLEEAAKRT